MELFLIVRKFIFKRTENFIIQTFPIFFSNRFSSGDILCRVWVLAEGPLIYNDY